MTVKRRFTYRVFGRKRIKSFWDMNDKDQREFVREILSEFQSIRNAKSEADSGHDESAP